MTNQLTVKEAQFLLYLFGSEYNSTGEIDCPVWTDCVIDYCDYDEKIARGVISSLIKKGFIIVDEFNKNETTVAGTKAGFNAFISCTFENSHDDEMKEYVLNNIKSSTYTKR